MKVVSQGFKNTLKKLGKEQDVIISYTIEETTTTLGVEQINSVSLHYDGGILQSVMKQLDIDSNVDIPLGTILNYQYGLKVSGTYEYINYGNFIVYSSEKQEDTKSYKIVCYDKMLYAMQEYKSKNLLNTTSFVNGYLTSDGTFVPANSVVLFDYIEVDGNTPYIASTNTNVQYFAIHEFDSNKTKIQGTQTTNTNINAITTDANTKYIRIHYQYNGSPMTQETINETQPQFEKGSIPFRFPITIRNYMITLCSYLGLTFANSTDTFANYNKQLTNELYLDEDGSSLNYTYRDIFDDLSQVVGGTICINDSDNLEIKYPKRTSNQEYIDLDYFIGSQSISINSTSYIYRIKFKLNKLEPFTIFKSDGGTTQVKIYSTGVELISNGVSYTSASYTFATNTIYELTIQYIQNSFLIRINDTQLIATSVSLTINAPIEFMQNVDNDLELYYIILGLKEYKPVFRTSDNKYGLKYNTDFIETNYVTQIPTTNNETLNKEYLKDENVNMSEILKPINTLTFKRTNDLDVYSISIPNTLPDNQKNEIAISDNQILNGSNRNQYASDILNKLYGLTYTLNDFKSTGICYLDFCDMYNIQVDNNTYPCIMFNDEINVSQGLEENIYAERPQESTTDYETASKNEREDERASIIIDKKIGEVDIRGKTINLTGDTINIASTNFNVDTDGNMSCNNANVSGTITSTNGTIGGWNITNSTLWHYITPPYDYSQSDIDRITAIWQGSITPTQQDYEKYDFNGDGVINASDVLVCKKLVDYNFMHSQPGKILFDVDDWFRPIKILNSSNEVLASFGVSGVITKDVE